jgi:hypothetical protein
VVAVCVNRIGKVVPSPEAIGLPEQDDIVDNAAAWGCSDIVADDAGVRLKFHRHSVRYAHPERVFKWTQAMDEIAGTDSHHQAILEGTPERIRLRVQRSTTRNEGVYYCFRLLPRRKAPEAVRETA